MRSEKPCRVRLGSFRRQLIRDFPASCLKNTLRCLLLSCSACLLTFKLHEYLDTK